MFVYPRQIRSTTPGAFALNAGAEPAPGYRLRRLRGRGGFAEVWESTAPGGRPAALKFMLSSNTSTTARELRSIQSFIAMDHPYMVKTYGVWSLPGYIVVDMELAEGTLLDLMLVYNTEFGEHLDPKVLGLHMWQVAEALDTLNARKHIRDGRKVGFQHGDIKPSNILLLNDVAKLTDYGLSTPTHGPMTPCPRAGTLDYAAPEVFQGHLTDYSDQFSLAVTYCVLRGGGFPFPKTTTDDVRQSFHRPPPDLSPFPPMEQVALGRALAPVPQDRYPGCREMMLAILKSQGLQVARDIEGKPRIVSDDESSVDSVATVFNANPSAVQKAPSQVQKAPSQFQKAPSQVQKAQPPIQKPASTITKPPSTISRAPSELGSPPSGLRRAPSGFLRPPTGTDPAGS